MSGGKVGRLAGGKEPKPRAAVSAKRREGYDKRRQATLASARAGAQSLRRRKLRVSPYSIEKETERLSKLPKSKVRKVSANTVRDNDLCRKLLDPDAAAVLERDPGKFPRWLRLLNRDELMELVMADRAWAADCSARLVQAEVENGRLRLIADFERRALARLRERVRLRTNEKLHQIARTERLQVSRIEGGLEISSPGISAKAGVSEGQSLSVAYAFLTSLLSEAPYRLPFVVDSPAGSLDKVNRREVGRLIPPFFDQMIMFVISSEREGFADTFYDRGEDVRFFTVLREDGSVRVDDRLSFFRTFQDREAVG